MKINVPFSLFERSARHSILIALLATVSLASCANPRYANGNSTVPIAAGDRSGNCIASFASGICVDFKWEKMPTETGDGSFLFKMLRHNKADGAPLPEDPLDEITVVLWMPAMGHSSSIVQVQRVDVGTFRVTKVFFSMKGRWEVHFLLKRNGTVIDQASLAVDI